MTLERKGRPGERHRSVGRTGFREMIASGWRTAPPQVFDFEVVLATHSAWQQSVEASPRVPDLPSVAPRKLPQSTPRAELSQHLAPVIEFRSRASASHPLSAPRRANSGSEARSTRDCSLSRSAARTSNEVGQKEYRMSKEIYISSTPHETRLAIVENDALTEIYYERENEYTLAGSIYNGKVTRVLPGMPSSFVDIGLERDAFLYITDFMEEAGDSADFDTNGNGDSRRRIGAAPAIEGTLATDQTTDSGNRP